MDLNEFEIYKREQKEICEREKAIALEIIELFKSNKLTVFQIDETICRVQKLVNQQSHL